MTTTTKIKPVQEFQRLTVPLCDIGVAPENPRFGTERDDGIAALAQTLDPKEGAGQILPLVVRKGKRSELPIMALDGQRRLWGFEDLVHAGVVENDHPVDVYLCETKAQAAAAILLLNSERAQPHPADRIETIAKLVAKKMSPSDIKKALGYKASEVDKLMRLASVTPRVLEAYRAGKLKERELRLLARIDDTDLQRHYADQAMAGHYFDEARLKAILQGDKTTEDDPRFTLVPLDAYVAAGGQVDADLFGELKDKIVDVDVLDELWRAKLTDVVDLLSETRGVPVFLAAGDRGVVVPEGLEASRSYLNAYDVGADLKAQFKLDERAFEEFVTEISGLVHSGDFDPARMAEYLWAEADLFGYGKVRQEVGAITLVPSAKTGVRARAALKPFVAREKTDEEVEAAAQAQAVLDAEKETRAAYSITARSTAAATAPKVKVDTEGLSHTLHDRRTDVASRGLMRDLADDPGVALTVLVARLLTSTTDAVSHTDTALRINANTYPMTYKVIPALDGEIRIRVRAWKDQWTASGLRPIAFVDGLALSEKMQLLADLTALSIDLREVGTQWVNHARRAEAAEISELLGSDIRRHWTPDTDFLSAHPKKLLLVMAADMEMDLAALEKTKKGDLVGVIEEAAAEKKYVPASLNWKAEFVEAAAADFAGEDEDLDDDQDFLGEDDQEDADGEADSQLDALVEGAHNELAPANDGSEAEASGTLEAHDDTAIAA